jgi:dTDP-4-amino-4,6-dideoxygalactose transaminase
VFEHDEMDAVDAVLRSGKVNYWTGNACREFEDKWSAAHDGLHSLSMANGSLTLDAAMRALGIGPGDEVIVSPRSYVASAMCVLLTGATPVFADVDQASGCITPETAEMVRSPRTRAVIPVHIGGWPCDMADFMAWAGRHGLHVIEDCAQAHGGHIDGRPVGTFGTLSSWSFCQDKIMTTGGEGGMLCTPDRKLHEQCWSYSQHGKDYRNTRMAGTSGPAPGFRWLVTGEGTNLRMTEMQAAIGLRQLTKLGRWSEARRRNAGVLHQALEGVPHLRIPAAPKGHAFYRAVVYTAGTEASALRERLLRDMHRQGIPATEGSCGEIYREEIFSARSATPASIRRGTLDSEGRLPVARGLAETSLTFFVHHTIDVETMRSYAKAVRDCMHRTMSAA